MKEKLVAAAKNVGVALGSLVIGFVQINALNTIGQIPYLNLVYLLSVTGLLGYGTLCVYRKLNK